jgi:signal transduction histidine kinase
MDFVNPAENPVIIPAGGVHARFVRVTATRLWERSSDFIFALAELQIYSGGRNVAPDGVVTSLDSIEVGTWSRKALVDGYNSQGRIVEFVDWLRGLSRRRAVQVELAVVESQEQRLAAGLARSAIRGAVALLLTAGVGFILWLQQIRSSRRRALQQLRERIAGDLHDEIGSNLGSIALLSQMALQQSADARADLAEINRVARETAASMRDIVWLIKPGAKTAEDFVAKLRETAGTMLTGVEWRLDAAEFSGPLSLEFQRQAVLIFKEALHNVRSHAFAKNVTIRLADTGRELFLEINDDGAGFDTSGASTGHGLVSMRQRAGTLGGELIVDSSPGRGTRLMLRIRMTAQLRAVTV